MWIFGLVLWSLLGFALFLSFMDMKYSGKLVMDNLNPIWQCKYNKIYWSDAIFVSIFWNLLCPLLSIGYWVYKLYIIGKKKNNRRNK